MNKIQLEGQELTDEDFIEYFQEEEQQRNEDWEGSEEDEFAGGAIAPTDLDQSS